MPEGNGKEVLIARNSLDDFIPMYLVSNVATPYDTREMAAEKLTGYIDKSNLFLELELTVRNILTTEIQLHKPVALWRDSRKHC